MLHVFIKYFSLCFRQFSDRFQTFNDTIKRLTDSETKWKCVWKTSKTGRSLKKLYVELEARVTIIWLSSIFRTNTDDLWTLTFGRVILSKVSSNFKKKISLKISFFMTFNKFPRMLWTHFTFRNSECCHGPRCSM